MSDIDRHNLEASIAAGPICVSLGGVPFNNHHIEYWKQRAIKAETDLSTMDSNHREMATQLAGIRAATIEECAKIADDVALEADTKSHHLKYDALSRAEGCYAGAEEIARKIRASTPARPARKMGGEG